MTHSEIIQVSGQPMRVAVGVPTQGAHRPAVLVMIHGPGLDQFIETQVDALARHGYAAASPDLFHRQPDDGSDAMTRVSRLLDTQIVDDADATIAYLDVLTGGAPRAVLGFCMGGRNTYLL